MAKDTQIQSRSGPLMRKLAIFMRDSLVFTLKPVEEALNDIDRLRRFYPEEPSFNFTPEELTVFKQICQQLEPQRKKQHTIKKSRRALMMKRALKYLKEHVCNETVTLQAEPGPFMLNFDWSKGASGDNQEDLVSFKNVLSSDDYGYTTKGSDTQWNFSNLDRADRIQAMYKTLREAHQGTDASVTSSKVFRGKEKLASFYTTGSQSPVRGAEESEPLVQPAARKLYVNTGAAVPTRRLEPESPVRLP